MLIFEILVVENLTLPTQNEIFKSYILVTFTAIFLPLPLAQQNFQI